MLPALAIGVLLLVIAAGDTRPTAAAREPETFTTARKVIAFDAGWRFSRTDAHRAYQGRGLAMLQSTATPGAITIRASAPGLEPATAIVTSVARRTSR